MYSELMAPQTMASTILNAFHGLSKAYDVSAITLLKVAKIITQAVEKRVDLETGMNTSDIVRNVFEHKNIEFLDAVSKICGNDGYLVISLMFVLYDLQGNPRN